MSDVTESQCDCAFFEEGDWVESRLNPAVYGIITGAFNFGQYYTVQLAGSLAYENFSAVTLQHRASDELPSEAAEPVADNVIRVDFTKARRLTPKSETEGVA